MNFLDLFAGIGGFALGARMAGMEFEEHYFSEVDEYAIKVYKKHFPKAIELGDITKIDAIDLAKRRIGNRCEWIITGGFP